jgi:hypothetical protein
MIFGGKSLATINIIASTEGSPPATISSYARLVVVPHKNKNRWYVMKL